MRRTLFVGAITLFPFTLALGQALPAQPILPGDSSVIVAVPDVCPVFEWLEAEGAQEGHLLRLFRLRPGHGEEPRTEPLPILEARLPAGQNRWQPPRSACLEPGVSYGWSLTALPEDPQFAGLASAMHFFEVVGTEDSDRPGDTGIESISQTSHLTKPAVAIGETYIQLYNKESHRGLVMAPNNHSASLWALLFTGQSRQMDIQTQGVGVVNRLTVGLLPENATNILQVKLGSATDPIADAWTTYSSRRWKRDIRDLEGALDKVVSLRGVSFQWEGTGQDDIGLIAEEVAPIVPEAVRRETGDDPEVQGIDYGRLVPLLVEAIKDQQRTIEELRRAVEHALVSEHGSPFSSSE